jgi:hypothetical protein
MVCLFCTTFSSSASIIFNFTIDDLGDDQRNSQIGDSFSITFFNDANFASGISSSDFQSLGYQNGFLGTESWDVSFCDNCLTPDLSSIFNFIDLGNGEWLLELLVGVTGNALVFADEDGENYIQLGQTISGDGSTSIAFGASGFRSSSVHYFQGNYVLRSNTIEVPEPNTIVLLMSALLLIRCTRK